MSCVIAYNDPLAGLVLLHPTPEALSLYGAELIARKDVPEGLAYKIFDSSELPGDRTFRAAWSIESKSLTDGVGASFTSF